MSKFLVDLRMVGRARERMVGMVRRIVGSYHA